MIRANIVKLSLLTAFLTASPYSFAEDFAIKWDEADAKRKQAADLGFEWRDTRKILKSAKKESEAGNTDKAMELVNQAMEQSMDAIAQSKREKDNWAARVPK